MGEEAMILLTEDEEYGLQRQNTVEQQGTIRKSIQNNLGNTMIVEDEEPEEETKEETKFQPSFCRINQACWNIDV